MRSGFTPESVQRSHRCPGCSFGSWSHAAVCFPGTEAARSYQRFSETQWNGNTSSPPSYSLLYHSLRLCFHCVSWSWSCVWVRSGCSDPHRTTDENQSLFVLQTVKDQYLPGSLTKTKITFKETQRKLWFVFFCVIYNVICIKCSLQ